MRKFILCFFLIFLFSKGVAQKQTGIEISYHNKDLKEVFQLISQKTGFKFYYLKDWLPEKAFSATYSNQTIDHILQQLLKDTVLNYYILDEKIIITQNSLVFDEFFLEDTTSVTQSFPSEGDKKPIFYNENTFDEEIITYKIGKEDNSSRKDVFELSGKVMNRENGFPLNNVAVIVEGEDKGTYTNIDGTYSISLGAGSHLITAKSLGNDVLTKRVIIYNDGSLNFQLKENFMELSEVVVDMKSDRNIKDAFTGVSQIDVQSIKTMPLVLGERDLLKAATTLPGISKAGEGALGFNIRGGREDQNLILLDQGIIYNPNHFFGIFSAINPFTTGGIEIYKGNIPARYGGRLSSVFDIRTKKGNTQELAGEGSIGPVTGNLALEIPIKKDKSSLILSGRATYSDWILKSLDEKSLSNSEASFYDVLANYTHQIDEKSDVSVTGYYSSDKFSITSDSLYSYQNRMFSGTYSRKLNEDLESSINVSNSDYAFDIRYESQYSDNFLNSFRINDTKLRLDFEHDISSAHNLNYGLSTKLYVIEPGKLEPLGQESSIEAKYLNKEKGIESAIYFSDEYNMSEDLLLNAGLRFSMFNVLGPDLVNHYASGEPKTDNSVIATSSFDNNEFIKTYSGLEYRFAARYKFADDFSLKGGYNSMMQYIHTLSNNTLVSPTDIYKLSDTHIKPQKAQQFSLGLFKNFNDNQYEISLEGYFKLTDNLIDFKTGAALFLNEFIETETIPGNGQSYGGEFLLKKNSGDLNGWLSYTYSRSFIKLDSEFQSRRVNMGEFFPSNFDKPHDFSAVLNYKITKRFSFSANFLYQTGRPVTYPIGKYEYNNSEYVVYSDRNKFRIPDYYRLDLSFNAEGNHKIEKLAHSFWSISIYNVLGRNNPFSVYFVTKDGQIEAYQSSIFAVPVPTITYNFKF